MFLKRGQPICEVLNPAGLRVHAVFNQADASWMNELSRDRFHVELRRVSDLGNVLTGGSAAPSSGARCRSDPTLSIFCAGPNILSSKSMVASMWIHMPIKSARAG